jgi:mycothiol maleylpyruvate isomerase-like protein
VSAKSDAIGELQTRHDAFRNRIAGLPADAYDEVWLGTWNLSQLLAHMEGWFGEMTGAIGRVAKGERPTPEGVDYSDADSWNVKFAANAKAGTAALAAWDSAYEGYRAAAEALPDDQYGVDPERGRPKIGNRLLQGAGIGHFEEHQGDLDAWLDARGSS